MHCLLSHIFDLQSFDLRITLPSIHTELMITTTYICFLLRIKNYAVNLFSMNKNNIFFVINTSFQIFFMTFAMQFIREKSNIVPYAY